MKRALTAALFGGLLIFFVPQAASGGSGNAHRVATYESTAGESGPGCATKPEGDTRQDPPGQGHSHYDKEHHDDDTLF